MKYLRTKITSDHWPGEDKREKNVTLLLNGDHHQDFRSTRGLYNTNREYHDYFMRALNFDQPGSRPEILEHQMRIEFKLTPVVIICENNYLTTALR